MANNASVDYLFIGTEEQVNKLENLCKDIKNGVTMIDIVKCMGVNENTISVYGDVQTYLRKDKNTIELNFICDWDWQRDFYNVMKTFFSEVYFTCEELGCELFECNTFTHFDCNIRYVLDGEFHDYFETLDEVKNYLKDDINGIETATTADDVNRLVEQYSTTNNIDLRFYEYTLITE
jgi:hypothetical protein